MSEFKNVFTKMSSLYKNRIRLGMSGYSQLFFYSFLFCYPSYSYAGPTGGAIVGGSGTISQADLTTTINQNTSSLAINWNSFDVGENETVNFIQPTSSSIALNRILSNSVSEIYGQIDANGQVVLVNPNGIFFSGTSSVNVGGLTAIGGMDILPTDFMNGDYVFNHVLGGDGAVINHGIINASLGGNVALIGKQVENQGVISAKLGSVTLASGKAAVLTFDQQGLLGVQVTEAVLQDELGIDPAVLNSGEINAEGGRVLLTASVSQDIFSQAVNAGELSQATSVVVNEDGTFTLGAGADVVNTGVVNVSNAELNQAAGQVIILGENITSSGLITADTSGTDGGLIEIHSKDTTRLTGDSLTSAKSLTSGSGGSIKVLGDKVGLFDNSVVDASGVTGGGEILIGGDREGKNTAIRNADFVYTDINTQVKADALINGDGGKIITFANNTARINGDLFARGGVLSGNGGFIETSGLKGFEINSTPDVSAANGMGGEWLIDPYNIAIVDSTYSIASDDAAFVLADAEAVDSGSGVSLVTDPFSAMETGATLEIFHIYEALKSGDVTIKTTSTEGTEGTDELGNISFETVLNYNEIGGNKTLTLNADNNITFGARKGIVDGDPSSVDVLNVNLFAKGSILLSSNSQIATNGGNFTAGFKHATDNTQDIIPISFANNGTINTTGNTNLNGGNITVTTSGTIVTGVLTANGGAALDDGTNGVPGRNGGIINLQASGAISIDGAISSNGKTGDRVPAEDFGQPGGDGGAITISTTSGDIIATTSTSTISSLGGIGEGDAETGGNADPGDGGNGNDILISTDAGSVTLFSVTSSGGAGVGSDVYPDTSAGAVSGDAGDITITGTTGISLNSNLTAKTGALAIKDGILGAGGRITLTGPVALLNSVTIDAAGENAAVDTNGDITINGTVAGTTPRIETLTLTGEDITFGGSIGTSGIELGDLTITATGAVNATGQNLFVNTLDVTNSTSFNSANITTAGAATAAEVTVSILSSGDITTGNVDASGDTATDSNGGLGGAITLDSSAGSIVVGSLTADGGAGVSSNAVVFTGAAAGVITLESGTTDGTDSITLNGNLSAVGGLDSTGANKAASANIDVFTPTVETTTDLSITGAQVTIQAATSTNDMLLGGSLTVTAQDGQNAQFFSNVDYNNLGNTGKTLTINADGNVNVAAISGGTNDLLNVVLKSDFDNDGTGNVNIYRSINTGGGAFSATGEDFTSASDALTGSAAAITIDTGAGLANIDMTGTVLLGGFTVGGSLDVTAGKAITQGLTNLSNDILDVTGVATFSSTGKLTTDDILLVNDNLLKGAINLSTNNSAAPSITLFEADITLNNIASETIINDINVFGELTVTAGHDLTVTGNVLGHSENGNNGNGGNIKDNTLLFDFGQVVDGTGNTFTSTDATIAGANKTTGNDEVKIFINGGASDDIFNINNVNFQYDDGTATTYINALEIKIDGKAGNDTFNIATDIAGSSKGEVKGDAGLDIFNINTGTLEILKIDGGNDTDTFNINTTAAVNISDLKGGGGNDILYGANRLNYWTLTGTNAGQLTELATAATSTIVFSEVESLTGNNDSDHFIINTGKLDGAIRGEVDDAVDNLGADSLTGSDNNRLWTITGLNQGTVQTDLISGFRGIESLIGNAKVDTFKFDGSTARLSGIIDGQGDNDILQVATSPAGNKSWTIDNLNEGTMTDLNIGNVDLNYGFTDIESIEAGSSADSFIIGKFGSLTGSLDGGTGIDTLTGKNVATTWTITDQGIGTITDTASTNKFIEGDFSGIENLTGGTENDSFIISADGVAGSLINTITGSTNATSADTNTLQALNAGGRTNGWVIDAAYSGSVSDEIDSLVSRFNLIQEVTGHDGVDSFEIKSNNIAGNGTVIDKISGGSATGNTLITSNTNDNSWSITAENEGSINDSSATLVSQFVDIQTLQGGDSSDTFTFALNGTLTGSVDGGGATGVDVIAGRNRATTWTINSLESGSFVDDLLVTVSFTGIESLTGGSSTDTYNFTYTDSVTYGSLSGLINGGSDTLISDTLNLFTDAGSITNIETNFSTITPFTTTVQLGAVPTSPASTDAYVGATNIETITAIDSTSALNTLIGDSTTSNSWYLDVNDSGSIGGAVLINSAEQGKVIYKNFANITGGDLADNFEFQNNATLTGFLNGGAGLDTVDFDTHKIDDVIVQLGSILNSDPAVTHHIDAVETITTSTNNTSKDTVIGADVNNTWFIGDLDTASISTGSGVSNIPTEGEVILNGFTTFTGGTAVDVFTIADTNLASKITIEGGSAGTLANEFDTLVGPDIVSRWDVDGTTGAVSTLRNADATGDFDISFKDIENLTGGSAVDDFRFVNEIIKGLVTGGGDIDIVDYSNISTIVTVEFVSTLTGINPLDSASLYVNDIETVIGNGGLTGNSVFIGADVNNLWTINGENSGFVKEDALNSQVITFSGVTELRGNNQTDSFTFTDNGSLDGLVNGGAGIDTINANAVLAENIWNVTTDYAGALETARDSSGVITASTTNFSFVEILNGNVNDDTFNITVDVSNGTFNGFIPGDLTVENGVDTLNAAAEVAGNDWAVSSNFAGTLNDSGTDAINFDGMDVLNGHTTSDRFTVSTSVDLGEFNALSPAILVSDTGVNSLTSAAVAGGNIWDVTSSNDGTLNTSGGANKIAFTGMNQLTGNDTDDDFVISTSTNFAGVIDGGGNTGVDTLSAFSSLTENIWSLNDWNNDTVSGALNTDTQFTAVENLVGGAKQDTFYLHDTVTYTGNIQGNALAVTETGQDKIVAGNRPNTWSVEGAESGTVTGLATTFTEIEILEGNADSDTFNLSNTVEFTGTISGNSVAISELVGAIDTVVAANQINIWDVTGAESGKVTGLGTIFTDIEALVGNANSDTFNLSSVAEFTGSITGNTLTVADLSTAVDTIVGANVDNIWTITGSESGEVTGLGGTFTDIEALLGNANSDTFNLDNSGEFTGTITGNALTVTDSVGAVDSIVGGNRPNSWTIEGAESGTVTGLASIFTDIEALVGNAEADTFNLSATEFTGTISGNTVADAVGAIDTVIGANQANTWTVTGAEAGNVTGLGSTFNEIEALQGNADSDTFNLSSIEFTGTIAGNALTIADTLGAVDTVVGANVANIWTVTGPESGDVTGLAGSFTDIEALLGNANSDTFNLSNSGEFAGTISGNALTVVDSLGAIDSIVGGNRPNSWTIEGAESGSVTGLASTFTDIEALVGNAESDIFNLSAAAEFTGTITGNTVADSVGAIDTIIGANQANMWTVTGAEAGNVTGLGSTFSEIEELQGNADSDTFNLSSIEFTGTIAGNALTIADILGAVDTIIGANVANIWTVTGSESGEVTGLAGTFTDIEALLGNANSDTFNLSNSGEFTGTISGNALTVADSVGAVDSIVGGNRVNTWSVVGAESGSVTGLASTFTDIEALVGNAESDTFNLSTAAEFTGTITGNTVADSVGAIDTIIGANQANTWTVTGAEAGNVTGLGSTFNEIEALQGNADSDTFNLSSIEFTGTIAGNALTIADTLGAVDTIIGANVANIWTVTGSESGEVTGLGGTFTDIEALLGNANSDTFNLSDSGEFTGTVTGNALTVADSVGAVDSIVGGNRVNSWTIEGAESGTVTGIATTFTDIEALVGNLDADTFNLHDTVDFNGTVTGNGLVGTETADDKIIAGDRANTWLISGTDTGNVTGLLNTFTDIELLFGGTKVDTFTVLNAGNVTGMLDGGSVVSGVVTGDVLDLTDKSSSINVQLGADETLIDSSLTTTNFFNVNNVETITASTPVTGTPTVTAVSNSIIGANEKQLWVLDGTNQGAVGDSALFTGTAIGGIPAADIEGITKFSNFDYVTGGTNDDAFRFVNSAIVTGVLSGGDHNIGDTIDLSLEEVVNVTVTFNDTTTTGVTELIEGYTGNGYNSTLTASNSSNLWTLIDVNRGTVLNRDALAADPAVEAFTFEGFNILVGGNQVDDFVVEAGGSLEAVIPPVGVTPPAGIVSGIFAGDGIDSLIVNLDGLTSNGALYFDGGTGIDNISFIDQTGSAGFDQAVFTPTASTDLDKDTVLYSFANTVSATNKYDVTYSNAELAANLDTVTDNVRATKLIVNGSSSDDIITIGSSSYQVVAATPATTFTPVTYTNKTHLDVIGGAGANDLINLSSNIGSSLADIHLGAETVNATTNNYSITANDLVLDTVALTTQPLVTNVTTLSITNSTTNPASNIQIVETDGVVINALQLTGSLDINAGDTILLSAPVSSTAAIDLTAATGDILMAEPANSLSGVLALRAVNGEIKLDNTALTTFGDVTTQTLTVNSSAGIRDNGTIIATNAVLNAGTTGTIDLRSPLNDFDTLEVGNALNIYITDIDGIQLSNINMGVGEFELNTGDIGIGDSASGISQLTGTRFTQEKTPVGLSGTVMFNAGANNIILDGENDFSGAVSLNNSGANNVQITDVDNIIFGTSKTGSGFLRVDAGAGALLPTDPGGISQVASSSIVQASDAAGNAGAVTLNAGFGIIDLDESGNDFVGSVSLNNTGTAAVRVTDINKIDLASSNVGGQLSIEALNNITQSAALSVGGDASFTVNAGESIILGDTANNFQGGVSFFSSTNLGLIANVTIANNAALNLGDISVSNNLDVFANGAVTNTGVLVSGGVTWINASGNAVTLDNSLNSTSLNDFNEIVIVSGSNVLVTDINDIKIGTTDALASGLIIDSDITAGLTVVTQTGGITDVAGSTLTVAGQTSLSAGAGSGDVELNETNNDFDIVDITSAQNVTLVDVSGIDLRSTTINGFLDVTAGNDIANSGALNVSGAASFSANDANDIMLDHTSNRLGGTLTFASTGTLANVVVNNTVATDIQALTVSNDLTISSAGTLSQSGGFNVGRVTRLTAIDASLADQDILLGSFVNNLTDVYVTNAHDVTIDNSANALTVSEMNASGAVNILSAGLIATTDIVGTDITLNSGANATQLVSVNATGAVNIFSEGLTVAEDLNGSSITGSGVLVDAGAGSALFTGGITSDSTVDVSATGITLNGAVSAVNDAAFDASSGVALLNNTIDVTTGNLSISGNGINQNNNLSVNTGNVSLNSTQAISMSGSTSTVVNNGNILYNAVDNVGVALLSAPNGTVEVNSGTGSINDANDTSVNFIADKLVLTAATGIGGGNELETQVDVLDALNTVSGDVRFAQSGGALVIDALKNDHSLGTDLEVSATIDLRSTGDVIFEPGSVVANRLQGRIFMSIDGDFLGDRSIPYDLENQEITAFSAAFTSLSGAFGVTGRPIVVNIPKLGSLLVNTRTNNIKYAPEKPDKLTTTGLDVGSLGVVSAIAGELLVEIESLGDIDPAIFTDLQNYSREEISIRLPRDQLFEDELDDEEELEEDLIDTEEADKYTQL